MENLYKIKSRTRGIPIQYGLIQLTQLEIENIQSLPNIEVFKEIEKNHYVRQILVNGNFVNAEKGNDVIEIIGNLNVDFINQQFSKKPGMR